MALSEIREQASEDIMTHNNKYPFSMPFTFVSSSPDLLPSNTRKSDMNIQNMFQSSGGSSII
jgi:hypothetical protein